MTREEFIENVITFDGLREFCISEDCDIGDCIYDSDARNEALDDEITDLAREYGWEDLYGILSGWDADSGYDYYIYNADEGTYYPARDTDFRELKNEVLDWMDANDYWPHPERDEDDVDPFWDEEPQESQDEDDDDISLPDEDCSVADMLSASFGCLVEISRAEKAEAEENDRAFFNLIV